MKAPFYLVLAGLLACDAATQVTLPAPEAGAVHKFGATVSGANLYSVFASASGDDTGALQVQSLVMVNRNASLRYLQVSDSASPPTNGAVPAFQIPVGAQQAFVIGSDFFGPPPGMRFVNGLSWGYSTTSGTFTAATAADHDLLVRLSP